MVPCLLAALTAHNISAQDLAGCLQHITNLPTVSQPLYTRSDHQQQDQLPEVPEPGSAQATACLNHVQVACEVLLGLATLGDPPPAATVATRHSPCDAVAVTAAPAAAAAAGQLLGWVLKTSCEEMYHQLLQGDLGEGPGAQLLLPCSAFLLRCAALPNWEEAWLEGCNQVTSAGGEF
jgi:hypothetical protein